MGRGETCLGGINCLKGQAGSSVSRESAVLELLDEVAEEEGTIGANKRGANRVKISSKSGVLILLTNSLFRVSGSFASIF